MLLLVVVGWTAPWRVCVRLWCLCVCLCVCALVVVVVPGGSWLRWVFFPPPSPPRMFMCLL